MEKKNKFYKAIMLEIDIADTIKKSKPDNMTMSEFVYYLLQKEYATNKRPVK